MMATRRDSMNAILAEKEATITKVTEDLHLDGNDPEAQKPTFTTLPAEVRKNIYKHLVDTELVNAGNPNVSYSHSIKDGVLQFSASRRPFPVSNSIFYVNKQISKEALSYFYSANLFIKLTIFSSEARHAKTMLEDSGVLFSTSSPSSVAACTRHAMDVSITEKCSAHKRAEVVFPAQYLPRLINFLDTASKATKSWGPSHGIEIAVRNKYDFPLAQLQGDLLEPWRILTNISTMEIAPDNISSIYAKGLETSITSKTFSPDDWLQCVTLLKETGNTAFAAGRFAEATQYYLSAIITLSSGYRTRAELLHSQPPEFTKKVQRLRWQCETNIAISEVKQGTDWQGTTPSQLATAKRLVFAEEAASNALAIVLNNPRRNPWASTLPLEAIPPNKEEWYSDAAKAKTWFRCASVHMALREFLWAAGGCERAKELSPRDAEIEKVFEEARDKIDWLVRPGRMLAKAMRMAR